jgi:hypothetical protein
VWASIGRSAGAAVAKSTPQWGVRAKRRTNDAPQRSEEQVRLESRGKTEDFYRERAKRMTNAAPQRSEEQVRLESRGKTEDFYRERAKRMTNAAPQQSEEQGRRDESSSRIFLRSRCQRCICTNVRWADHCGQGGGWK